MQTTSKDSSKMYGEYRALVISTTPPAPRDNLLLVQIKLIGLWDDAIKANLPWAEYKFPVGHRPLEGDFTPVQVDDVVWVDFVNGDTRYPRITGGCHYAPEGVPNTPPEAYVPEEPFEHDRHEDEPEVPPTEYHSNKTMRFGGSMVEATKEGHYRITNLNSKAAFEITEDGQIVLHATDTIYFSGTGLKLAIEGDTQIDLVGNLTSTITGDVVEKITGNATLDVSESVNVTSEGEMTFAAGGSLNLTASSSVHINGSTVHINE